jgi:hypothetical protein
MSVEVWLCVERGNPMRPTSYISWAKGSDAEEHCWYLGGGRHYPECGLYRLTRVLAEHREDEA